MFVFLQTPERVLRVVHETWYNHSKNRGLGNVDSTSGGKFLPED
jgi:hypothetical protein